MSNLAIDWVKPRSFGYKAPGSIDQIRVTPTSLHVIVAGMGRASMCNDEFDATAEVASASLTPIGGIAALAFTLGTIKEADHSYPVETRVISDPDLLRRILLHAKTIGQVTSELSGISATEIHEGNVYTVGRDPSCDIALPAHATFASRKSHLTIVNYPYSLTRRFAPDYSLFSVAQGSLPTTYAPESGDRIYQDGKNDQFTVLGRSGIRDRQFSVDPNLNGSVRFSREFDS